MPRKFDSRPSWSVSGTQVLSAGLKRYAPPTSVRAYTRSFSTGLKMVPLTKPPPRMATFFQLYFTVPAGPPPPPPVGAAGAACAAGVAAAAAAVPAVFAGSMHEHTVQP